MSVRGPKREIECPACGQRSLRTVSDINRAAKDGLRIFCNRECAGVGRRVESPVSPRNPNWKAMKKEYDKKYRQQNIEKLKREKKEYYARTGPLRRDKEREARKKRMPMHVEYCRRPEYRIKKKDYDLDRRAKAFGEFSESYKILLEIQKEVLSRVTRAEIGQQNGTINKSTKRKDEYGRITGQTKRR